MHSEFAMLSADTASRLNALRHSGGRIFAVGTTSLRTLESAADGEGILHPLAEETDIFITPGYAFRCVQGLLTNFHLPRSTLFMLVCALMGTEVMKNAYADAISEKYRFYSYGDACLLLPAA
jgi:S-adenosylmethionine:tRNA ribosyltransferase-isomerase